MNASLERRAKRGEEVETVRQGHGQALLASGAGELFQAVDGDEILSSMLILRASQGAYYESAGTSPDGMKIGASPFLVSRVAHVLKKKAAASSTWEAPPRTILACSDSKPGFGTREVALEAASFCPEVPGRSQSSYRPA